MAHNIVNKRISRIVMQWLLVCVLVAFGVTAFVSFDINTRLSKQGTETVLTHSVEDLVANLENDEANGMRMSLEGFVSVLEDPDVWDYINTEYLEGLARVNNITEVHIADSTGHIVQSSTQELQGFDFRSSKQSEQFLRLLESGGDDYFMQEMTKRGVDSIPYIYSGYRLKKHKGFVQIGYVLDDYYNNVLAPLLVGYTEYRRIGETGRLFIVNEAGNIVSAHTDFKGVSIEDAGLTMKDINSHEPFELFETMMNDQAAYCMHYNYKNRFDIIAVQPMSEATLTRDMTVKYSSVTVLIIFILLFIVVYLLMHELVVNNIEKVNNSLGKITEGDLEEKVDVRNSVEFSSLSDDINNTVDRLKDFIHEAETRIDADLALAQSIQTATLPNVFPAYPDHDEFDIYACTHPAKVVGGDFYDFYFVSDCKIAIVIADVSGKGIPAAMFMMRAKAMIKNLASNGMPIGEVVEKVNATLCQGNETNTFSTAWIAYVDISTGELEYVNAGHNVPLLCHSGGKYEYVTDERPDLPLGAFEMPYTVKRLQMNPGDTIFLYTDGITEAENPESKLYGDDRLRNTLDALLSSSANDSQKICHEVVSSVHTFANGAEQSDDITMLCLRYVG